jgi:hypothetical protein
MTRDTLISAVVVAQGKQKRCVELLALPMRIDESFTWQVDSDGYTWMWSGPGTPESSHPTDQSFGWKLIPNGGSLRSYAPIRDQPGLFLRMAELATCVGIEERPSASNMKSVEAFANQFGLLRLQHRQDDRSSFFHILDDLAPLGFAVELWKALAAKDDDAVWNTANGNLAWHTFRFGSPHLEHSLRTFFGGVDLESGSWALAELFGDSKVPLSFQPSMQPGRFLEAVLGPRKQVDAAWVKLLIAVTEGTVVKVCAWCERSYPLRRGRERSTKQYCTDACRIAAWRYGTRGPSRRNRGQSKKTDGRIEG